MRAAVDVVGANSDGIGADSGSAEQPMDRAAATAVIATSLGHCGLTITMIRTDDWCQE